MGKINIFEQNEIDGNRAAASVMGVTECVYILVYILNVLGIFIIETQAMNLAFLLGSIVLMMPTIINHFVDNGHPALKYIYIADALAFILITTSILSYHVITIYAYPIMIACLYFSRSVTLIAILVTPVVVTIGQLASFQLKYVVDYNFDTMKRLVTFSIVPRALTLVALGAIMRMMTNRTADMLDKQQQAVEKVFRHQQNMISSIAILAESRDLVAKQHAERVSLYAVELAKAMKQSGLYPKVLTDSYIENLKMASRLHDIGRISVSDTIMLKPGKLNSEEFEIVKTHTTKGGELLTQTFKSDDETYQQMVYDVAMHHHERWNGRGYPDGQRESMITLAARIVAVCDVFEAISHKRSYRDALPMEECFDIIRRGSGIDFDPMIVNVFLANQDKMLAIHEMKIE